jgi:hypothetical protein
MGICTGRALTARPEALGCEKLTFQADETPLQLQEADLPSAWRTRIPILQPYEEHGYKTLLLQACPAWGLQALKDYLFASPCALPSLV